LKLIKELDDSKSFLHHQFLKLHQENIFATPVKVFLFAQQTERLQQL